MPFLGGSPTYALRKTWSSQIGLWRTTTRSLSIVTLLLTGAVLLHAQGRHGLWLEAGMGYGSASFSCDTCGRSQRLGGYTVSVDIGGTLSEHFRLGGSLQDWFNGLKPSAPLAGIATTELVLSYYPRICGGSFVEMGGGLSEYNLGKGTGDIIDPYSTDTTYYSGTGWGFTLGAGWEIPIGEGAALRPILTYHHGAVPRLHSPDGATVVSGWKQNLLTAEVRLLVGQV